MAQSFVSNSNGVNSNPSTTANLQDMSSVSNSNGVNSNATGLAKLN